MIGFARSIAFAIAIFPTLVHAQIPVRSSGNHSAVVAYEYQAGAYKDARPEATALQVATYARTHRHHSEVSGASRGKTIHGQME
jgi:hypothetical protein